MKNVNLHTKHPVNSGTGKNSKTCYSAAKLMGAFPNAPLQEMAVGCLSPVILSEVNHIQWVTGNIITFVIST